MKAAICLCVVLSLLVLAGCGRSGANARQPSDYFKTTFQDESQFIVETITSDLARMAYYAKTGKSPTRKRFSVQVIETRRPMGTPRYEISIRFKSRTPDVTQQLDVVAPIWSPEVYDGLCSAAAKAVKLDAASPDANLARAPLLATQLLDSRASTIERLNLALSDQLRTQFNQPVLHERAALLLGAFALRAYSHQFYDVRWPLCRMTAHLAFARLLSNRAAPGVDGQLAEVILFTLMSNQAAALQKLDGITSNDPAVAKWARVLRARNTGDYRPLANQKDSSRLERVAWFHAFTCSVEASRGWENLSEDEKTSGADFTRIALTGGGSIQVGHQLLALSLPLEISEAAELYKLSHGKELAKGDIVDALNAMPEGCLSPDGKTTIRVISWGQWAMFLQRQLCQALSENFDFLENRWGVKDKAQAYSAQADKLFGGLRLYPFVRRFNCTTEQAYRKSIDDGFEVTVATPHLVPPTCWNFLCYREAFCPHYTPNPNPHVNEWHKHNPPPGTAYNVWPRLDHPSLTSRPDTLDRIHRLHELAPYDQAISRYLTKLKFKEAPTYAQTLPIFKPVLEFNTWAMKDVARTLENEPGRYEQLLLKAAVLDPSVWFRLGDYFIARTNDAKTIAYYEKGYKLDSDAVTASAAASWMVDYYLDRGNTNRAREIADFAGDVYSSAGLRAKAEFFEATGNYDEALVWYKKIDERYDWPLPMIQFCSRYKKKTADARYDGESNAALAKLFPKGAEKASLAHFKSAPTDGVLLRVGNESTRLAGLNKRDIVVAVNGQRVRTLDQFCYTREFSGSPEMRLIVWQTNQYREIKAIAAIKSFGREWADYRAN